MRLFSSIIMVKIIAMIMLIKLIAGLRVMPNHRKYVEKIENNVNGNTLARILNTLTSTKQSERSRRINLESLTNAQNMYSRLSKHVPKHKLKKLTRQQPEEVADTVNEQVQDVVNNEQEIIVEHELVDALTKHSSALLEMPYLEKKGRNDFLVMKPDVSDPFVTVIPNAIYYNIEKKCVNWLDDCSLQGIRNRLLNRVQSPF